MNYKIIKQFGFNGIVEDGDGKSHHIHQTWCEKCGILMSEVHFNCCGFSSNGWTALGCGCEDKEKRKGETI
jgi:hypothetical protein